jgi:TalC/MipB family fructose-6-phosphate aldolase
MSLYVDCAYLEDVAAVCQTFPVDGVTTNPSILLAAVERGQRLTDLDVLAELLRVCDGPVFMQPTADAPSSGSPAALADAAMRYLAVEPARVVVKLPATLVGLGAAHELRRQGARLAFTATYTLAQAYCAVQAGAQWVIPYFGRMRRSGVDALDRIESMADLLARQSSGARILAASVKSPADLVEVSRAGAHDVTAPPEVIRSLMDDDLTRDAVAQFAADWRRLRDTLG